MADILRPPSIEDLPSHLIVEILSCGKLSVVDLVCLELVSRAFRGSHHGLFPPSFRSLVDFAAFQLCGSHPIYAPMSPNARNGVFNRCRGNWKRVLRFLQSVEQSSNVVETSLGNVVLLLLLLLLFGTNRAWLLNCDFFLLAMVEFDVWMANKWPHSIAVMAMVKLLECHYENPQEVLETDQ